MKKIIFAIAALAAVQANATTSDIAALAAQYEITAGSANAEMAQAFISENLPAVCMNSGICF